MIKFISKLLYKIPNPKIFGVIYLRFLIAVLFGFGSFFSFISIGSAAADKAGNNGLLSVSGVVLGLLCIAFFAVAASENEPTKRK